MKIFQKIKELEKKQKIIIYSSFAAILLLVLSVSSYASYQYFSKRIYQEKNKETDSPIELEANFLDVNNVEEEDKNKLSVLLLGYGGAGHQGGYLTDVIQLAHFDFEKKKLFLISIPRDLNINLADGNSRKINSLMFYAMAGKDPMKKGGEFAATQVSKITAIPIKYFMAIDFNGFKRSIGAELKGINVNVTQAFDDPWYPIEGQQLNPCGHSPEKIAQMTATLSGFELEKQFECRYEHIHYDVGTVRMEGGDALAYVRSRHSTSDFDRSRRQVEVLDGIRQRIFSLNALSNIPQYYKAFTNHIQTNFDLETVEYLAPLFINANELEIVSINLSTANVLQNGNNGSYALIPKSGVNNWSGIQSFIKSHF